MILSFPRLSLFRVNSTLTALVFACSRRVNWLISNARSSASSSGSGCNAMQCCCVCDFGYQVCYEDNFRIRVTERSV